MKTKGLSLRLITYEIRNACGNLFTFFFGIIFPIFMSALISKAFLADIPPEEVWVADTGIFITMMMIIPMATLLIGYAASYSQELENHTPLRFRLFGFSERSILTAKIIANLIYMTGAILIYVIAELFLLKIQTPAFGSVVCLFFAIYALGTVLLILAHAIASLCGKFGPTYGITMALYFGFMILCGMMGFPVDRLPSGLQSISNLLPMTYIGRDFATFWQGGGYDFKPLILSFICFAVVSFVLLFISVWKNKGTVKRV